MREVIQRLQFRNDIRRMRRHDMDFEELKIVVDLLAEHGELPAGYQPHHLEGDWKGAWECHIEPDWLLIYEITDREVILLRTGTHSDLFD
jgi:mRNA interferase YafQ